MESSVDSLTDEQVRQLVADKMKKLEKYNRMLDHEEEIKRKKLQSMPVKMIKAIIDFQKIYRGWLCRRNFFRAVRENEKMELR